MSEFPPVKLNLSLKQFGGEHVVSNPASIAPKANLANLVSFHWGRSADLEQCKPHVRGYTDWTSDVGANGDTYIALPQLEILNFRIHGGTQSKPVKIRLPASTVPIDTLARQFPHAPVRVRIAEVDPDNPTQTYKPLLIGDVTRASKGRLGRSSIVELEISSHKIRLDVSIGIIANTTCAWALGDKNCCIDLGPLPVVETYRRILMVNDQATTASSILLREQEILDNVVIFTGEGHVSKAMTHLSDTAAGLLGCFVDQKSGDFMSCMATDSGDGFPEGILWDGVKRTMRWVKYTGSQLAYIHGIFTPKDGPAAGDIIVGGDRHGANTSLHRLDRETGITRWQVDPSQFASNNDRIPKVRFDGADIFALTEEGSGFTKYVTPFDLDGVEGTSFEDANTGIDVPVFNDLLVDATDLYVAANDQDMTAGGDKNLWKWDKATPAAPSWSVLVEGNVDLIGMVFYNGSLWVVGDNLGSKNFWEINPATGAVLNSYNIGGGSLACRGIELDDETGIAYVLGDISAVGRVHLIDLNAVDPSVIVASWFDTTGNEGSGNAIAILPTAIGERELREILAVDGSSIQFTAALPDPNSTGRRFERGYLENDDLRIMIREQTSLVEVQLIREPPPEWVPGFKVSVTPGCDKTIETCRAEYDREERFGGNGFAIPRYNPLFGSS